MTRLRNLVLKVGGVLSRGGRWLLFDIADGVAPLWQTVLKRLNRLRPYERTTGFPRNNGFVPLPSHAFVHFTPRM